MPCSPRSFPVCMVVTLLLLPACGERVAVRPGPSDPADACGLERTIFRSPQSYVRNEELSGSTFALVDREQALVPGPGLPEGLQKRLEAGEEAFVRMLTEVGLEQVEARERPPDLWLIAMASTAEAGERWSCADARVWTYWQWEYTPCLDDDAAKRVADFGACPGSIMVALLKPETMSLIFGVTAFGPEPDVARALRGYGPQLLAGRGDPG